MAQYSIAAPSIRLRLTHFGQRCNVHEERLRASLAGVGTKHRAAGAIGRAGPASLT